MFYEVAILDHYFFSAADANFMGNALHALFGGRVRISLAQCHTLSNALSPLPYENIYFIDRRGALMRTRLM